MQVLDYVASMLEITKEELADLSTQNESKMTRDYIDSLYKHFWDNFGFDFYV